MAIILERQGNWTLNPGVDRSTDVAYNPASPYIQFSFDATDLFTDKDNRVSIDMAIEVSFDNGNSWVAWATGRCEGKAAIPTGPGGTEDPFCRIKIGWGSTARPDRVRIAFDLINEGLPAWNAIQLTDYTVEDGL